MSRLSVCGVLVAALVAVVTPGPASAVTYHKLAYLTFNAPVQIPLGYTNSYPLYSPP